MLALLGLFLAALVAATLIPAQSEAVLVALLLDRSHPALLLVFVATLGNVLGALINWWLGRQAQHLETRRWYPLSAAKRERVQAWYRRYGRWSLLLAWAPVIGDPITLVAGVMREPLRAFLPLVILAKGGRYTLLALVTLGLM